MKLENEEAEGSAIMENIAPSKRIAGKIYIELEF